MYLVWHHGAKVDDLAVLPFAASLQKTNTNSRPSNADSSTVRGGGSTGNQSTNALAVSPAFAGTGGRANLTQGRRN